MRAWEHGEQGAVQFNQMFPSEGGVTFACHVWPQRMLQENGEDQVGPGPHSEVSDIPAHVTPPPQVMALRV